MIIKRIPEKWVKPIVTLSSGLGVVQGLIWTVLSILGLAVHAGLITFDFRNMITDYGLLMYIFFFVDHGHWFDTNHEGCFLLVTPNIFAGFLWFYAVLSIIWVVASITIPVIVFKKHHLARSSYTFWIWPTITFILTLTDIVLVILLSIDARALYHYFQPHVILDKADIITVYNFMITLAARGYLFLVLNTLAAVFVYLIGVDEFSIKANIKSSLLLTLTIGAICVLVVTTVILTIFAIILDQNVLAHMLQ